MTRAPRSGELPVKHEPDSDASASLSDSDSDSQSESTGPATARAFDRDTFNLIQGGHCGPTFRVSVYSTPAAAVRLG